MIILSMPAKHEKSTYKTCTISIEKITNVTLQQIMKNATIHLWLYYITLKTLFYRKCAWTLMSMISLRKKYIYVHTTSVHDETLYKLCCKINILLMMKI